MQNDTNTDDSNTNTGDGSSADESANAGTPQEQTQQVAEPKADLRIVITPFHLHYPAGLAGASYRGGPGTVVDMNDPVEAILCKEQMHKLVPAPAGAVVTQHDHPAVERLRMKLLGTEPVAPTEERYEPQQGDGTPPNVTSVQRFRGIAHAEAQKAAAAAVADPASVPPIPAPKASGRKSIRRGAHARGGANYVEIEG